jgi:hypothetical protein
MRARAATWLRRGAVCGLVALTWAGAPGVALAQPATVEMPPMEEDQPPIEVRPGGVSCQEINNRAMEASLVIRQHASALSVGIDPEARAQGMVLLAYLDQWSGRLRGLVDLGDFSDCLDDGEAETYRRALAVATRVANQAREELYRRPGPPPAPRNRRN